MASINTIVKRKQYLWLGIVVVGAASAIGGVLYLSDVDMSGNGEAVAEQEPVSGELITGRRQLQEGMVFTPGSTVIVDQGEKLSLKETLTLLDGAARHNVQVLITDSGQRTGTGSALMAMKDAGVNTYRWQGGEQRPATIISEPDRNVRYDRLAGDFAASVKAGEESVAQVSGVREQAILTQAIRSELKTQGVLGHPEVTMTALSPVWLDSRSRYLRDMYRPGMVMEQWNPETRSHDRYVIDRVAGLVMTVLTVGLASCAGKSLPRFWPGDFFPVFYACHLAVLGVLAL